MKFECLYCGGNNEPEEDDYAQCPDCGCPLGWDPELEFMMMMREHE